MSCLKLMDVTVLSKLILFSYSDVHFPVGTSLSQFNSFMILHNTLLDGFYCDYNKQAKQEQATVSYLIIFLLS